MSDKERIKENIKKELFGDIDIESSLRYTSSPFDLAHADIFIRARLGILLSKSIRRCFIFPPLFYHTFF